jgi:hypothetical protein
VWSLSCSIVFSRSRAAASKHSSTSVTLHPPGAVTSIKSVSHTTWRLRQFASLPHPTVRRTPHGNFFEPRAQHVNHRCKRRGFLRV